MSALMGSVYCEARPAFAMPCQVEVDGGPFEPRVYGVIHREDAGQRLRRRRSRAAFLRRIAVVIANEPSGLIDRQIEAVGDALPAGSVRAVQATGEVRGLA